MLTISSGEREPVEPCGIEPLRSIAAHDDRDGTDILAHFSHGDAGEQRLTLVRDVARRQADGAEPILIDHEMHRRRTLAPVVIYLAQPPGRDTTIPPPGGKPAPNGRATCRERACQYV